MEFEKALGFVFESLFAADFVRAFAAIFIKKRDGKN
jgi:hypothetical protein